MRVLYCSACERWWREGNGHVADGKNWRYGVLPSETTILSCECPDHALPNTHHEEVLTAITEHGDGTAH